MDHKQWGKVDFHFPFRAVSSISFTHQEEQGFTFSPFVSYKQLDAWHKNHEIYFNLGLTWATRKLHQYFYEVPGELATADRAAYKSDAGYLGSFATVAYIIPIGIHNFYTFAGVDHHHGAANEASPLFINKTNYSVGVGMSWNLWQSNNLVKVNPRF